MPKRSLLATIASVLMLAAVMSEALPGAQAQVKGKPPGKKAPPKSGKKAPAGPFAVQARSARPKVHRAANAVAARAMAAKFRRAGWNASVKKKAGGYVVTASMRRWKTRAVVASHGLAVGKANVLRRHGFQTRIHAVKKR